MKPNLLRISILGLSILGISLLHYLTPLHLHYLHDIFQRFYYLPIILSALWFGFRGGLSCALIVSVVYAPHILFQWGGHLTLEMEKYLEIAPLQRSWRRYRYAGPAGDGNAARNWSGPLRGWMNPCKKLQAQSERLIVVEEQLRRAEKLSTLGEMAAVLAHEIRNPLGSIRGTAEILRDDYRPGDPKHEFIEIQIKETERLNHVVEDFLRMSRQQPVELRDCSLREELETIVTLVARDAHDRGIFLRLEQGAEQGIIRGDGEKLRQAFLNIVINALQATPSGGTVAIVLEKGETGFEVSFRDSGSGVTSDNLQRIFEPFYTTKPDGTGLGLAVTRKIIEGHGGILAIESEVCKGTTVTVTLPQKSEGKV